MREKDNYLWVKRFTEVYRDPLNQKMRDFPPGKDGTLELPR